MKKKKPNLKKKLDAVFSKYIRAKYGKNCYTCGRFSDKLQCGHFVSRQYLATRWDESNARPQCIGCNIYGRGQFLTFEDNLVKELGREEVDALKDKRFQVHKIPPSWYEEEIERYTHLLLELDGV